jgi:hypothetical protein
MLDKFVCDSAEIIKSFYMVPQRKYSRLIDPVRRNELRLMNRKDRHIIQKSNALQPLLEKKER